MNWKMLGRVLLEMIGFIFLLAVAYAYLALIWAFI